MLGDFYIDLNNKKAPDVKELLFTTKALGLKQMVEEATRVSICDGAAKKSKLDLIFTNSDSFVDCKTLDLKISDHYIYR